MIVFQPYQKAFQVKKYYFWITIIFVGGILLRAGLAIYNRQANDPHLPVVRLILRNDVLPEKNDCWECFQPKLFHSVLANLFERMRLVTNRDVDAQKVVAQLLNVLAGCITLWIIIRFLRSQPAIGDRTKLLVFLLLAFNPQFIGINSQVTNDTFLILFCVAASYFAFLFLKSRQIASYFLVVCFSIFAVLTKTNGWVTVIAITLSLLIKVYGAKISDWRNLVYALLYPLLVISVVTLSPLSQYVGNYQKYGSPILLNIEKQPAPQIIMQTDVPYAGIRSIQDGFFTFKFADLLKNPVTGLLDDVENTSHRTSLWTRLYGSANSLHFENFPPSWRTPGSAVEWVSRGIFILALIPLMFLLVGAVVDVWQTVTGLLRRDEVSLSDISYGLFSLLFIGYMSFSVLYAFQYRTYNVMKAVFVYPGMLAYMFLGLRTVNIFFTHPGISNGYKTIIVVLFVALSILYVFDVGILYIQLLPNGSGLEILLDSLQRAWR